MNKRIRKILLSGLITLAMTAGLPGNTEAVFAGSLPETAEDELYEDVTELFDEDIDEGPESETDELPDISSSMIETAETGADGNVISGDVSGQLIQEGSFPDFTENSGNDRFVPDEEQPDYDSASDTVTEAINGWTGGSYVTADISESRIPVSDVEKLLADVINDHPEFFFVDGAYICNADTQDRVLSLSVRIKDGMTDKYTDAFNEKAAIILAGVDDGWTDLQKAMYIHDYLVTHVQYDLTYKHYDAESAIVGGSAVCEGYSLAYKYLMNRLDSRFKCDYVGSNTLNHAWNYLTVNNKQYYVDCTWDDPLFTGNNYFYEYHCRHSNFMLSRDEMYKTHGSTDWKNKSGINIYNSVKGAKDYDDAPWLETNSPIPMIGNIGAYSTGYNNISLYTYDFIAKASNKLADYNALWNVWGSSGYYLASYTSLSSAGNCFTATTPTEILLINSSTGEKKSAYKLNDSEKSKGYIYGTYMDNGKLHYHLYTSCGSERTGDGTVDLSKYEDEMIRVVLEKTSLSIDIDESVQLKAAVLPEDTVNKKVIFTSMDPKIAAVDDTGKVTGISNGKTIIVAKPAAGGKSAYCKIRVGSGTQSGLDTVFSASNSDTLYLMKGKKYSLDSDYSFVSSDPGSVEIINKNTVKGKKAAAGVSIIGKPDSGNGDTITYKVYVIAPSLTKKAVLIVGETQKLTLDLNGYEDDCNVTWYSSNPSVVSVEEGDGKIKATGKGSAKVTAWVNGKALNSTVKVVEKKSIKSIKGDSLTLQPFQTISLKFSDGFKVKNAQWSSSLSLNVIKNRSGKTVAYQDSVVRIGTNGKIKAIGSGDTTITAVTANGIKSLKITVPVPAVRTFYVLAGKSKKFSIMGIKPKELEWHSEKEETATVKNGKILAGNTPGKTKISAHYDPYETGKGFDYSIDVYTESPVFTTSSNGVLKKANAAGTVYELNIGSGKECKISVNNVYEPILFKSKNNDIAFADEFTDNTGVIFGRKTGKNDKPGKTVLTTKIAGKTYTINVIVSK